MTYASDAYDDELLDQGDIAGLLAKYDPVIVGRCVARLRGHPDADDVAQDVKLRLLAEFRRGKRYGSTPYRVVVHQVVSWTLADYFAGRPTHAPLPEGWEAAAEEDPAGEVMSRYYLTTLFEALPPRAREVAELLYLEGLDPDQVAERLELEPNAVHQATYRVHKGLRELILDG